MRRVLRVLSFRTLRTILVSKMGAPSGRTANVKTACAKKEEYSASTAALNSQGFHSDSSRRAMPSLLGRIAFAVGVVPVAAGGGTNPAFADAHGYTQARIDDTATAVIRHVHSDNPNEFLHCLGAWTRPGVQPCTGIENIKSFDG